jgi:hypothetical protein
VEEGQLRKIPLSKSAKKTLAVPPGTSAKIVTNGYGNFWIEIESPYKPSLFLDTLRRAGWIIDKIITSESEKRTTSLVVRTGHKGTDEWSYKEMRGLAVKARKDLRKFGLANISEVDRGI